MLYFERVLTVKTRVPYVFALPPENYRLAGTSKVDVQC
jgi:hypothetical protein